MLSDDPLTRRIDHFRHFKSLSLPAALGPTQSEPQHAPSRVLELLFDVISRSYSLSRLSMSTNSVSDDMLMILSRLQTIQELELYGYGDKILKLLVTMDSPVESIRLCFSTPNPPVPSNSKDYFPLLQNYQSTLTRLELIGCDPRLMHCQLPFVTELKIRTITRATAAAMMFTCPNVRLLSFHTRGEELFGRVPIIAEANRDLSLQRQRTLKERWSVLDELEGTTINLYSLGLPCKVESLHLGLVSPKDLKYFSQILQDVTPSVLNIDLPLDTVMEGKLILQEVLASTAIRSLDLGVIFHQPPNIEVETKLVGVVSLS